MPRQPSYLFCDVNRSTQNLFSMPRIFGRMTFSFPLSTARRRHLDVLRSPTSAQTQNRARQLVNWSKCETPFKPSKRPRQRVLTKRPCNVICRDTASVERKLIPESDKPICCSNSKRRYHRSNAQILAETRLQQSLRIYTV